MRDRWEKIPHFYHRFVIWQAQVECPKSVRLFGYTLPTAVAMNAQAVGPSISLPLTSRKSATNAP